MVDGSGLGGVVDSFSGVVDSVVVDGPVGMLSEARGVSDGSWESFPDSDSALRRFSMTRACVINLQVSDGL